MCVITVCVYLQTKTKDCSLCAYVVVVVLFFIHCEIVIFHRPNIEDDPTRFCFSLKTEKKRRNLSLTGVCVVVFLVLFLFWFSILIEKCWFIIYIIIKWL